MCYRVRDLHAERMHRIVYGLVTAPARMVVSDMLMANRVYGDVLFVI